MKATQLSGDQLRAVSFEVINSQARGCFFTGHFILVYRSQRKRDAKRGNAKEGYRVTQKRTDYKREL